MKKIRLLLMPVVLVQICAEALIAQIIHVVPPEPLIHERITDPEKRNPEIDINGDGTIDLLFRMSGFSQAIPYTEEIAWDVRPAENVKVVVGSTSIGSWVTAPAVHRFEEDALIGPELPEDTSWTTSRSNLLVDGKMWDPFKNPPEPPDHTWRQGNFADEIGFMGFEFGVDDDVLYGWIRIDGTREEKALYIIDWAYNTVPGEPIRAGEIPEPRTFALVAGLLSLVFVGLWRWRRRRL